jgi:hypothetical protein
MMLPMTLNLMAEASVSLKRMETFFTAAELDTQPTRVADSPFAIAITDASFRWEATAPADEDAASIIAAALEGGGGGRGGHGGTCDS